MRSVDAYSELECLVLGLIALGANSGYAMRKAMQKMRGNRWSVESGSIYRALHRLEKDELVYEAARVGIPNRQRIEYALTPTGSIVLQSWLERTPPMEEFEQICDPIRTRAYFLELLEPNMRNQIVKTWISESKRFIEGLRSESTEITPSDSMESFSVRSLLMQSEARHDWLRKLFESVRGRRDGSKN